MGNNKLTGGVDGVGVKIEGSGVKAMPRRQRRVGFIGADVVEGEFNVRK
jgi:hypothetical protein